MAETDNWVPLPGVTRLNIRSHPLGAAPKMRWRDIAALIVIVPLFLAISIPMATYSEWTDHE